MIDVNCHTTFGDLKTVIVGIETSKLVRDLTYIGANFYGIKSKLITHPLNRVLKRIEQLDSLSLILEQNGIEVLRPDYINDDIIPSNVRDILFCFGDTLYKMALPLKYRVNEFKCLENIFKNINKIVEFKQIQNEPSTESLNYIIKENNKVEACMDGANIIPLGKDWIVNVASDSQYNMFLELKKINPDINMHIVTMDTSHLDGSFRIVRPGLIFVKDLSYITNRIPKIFKNWEIVKIEHIKGHRKDGAYLCSEMGMNLNFLMLSTNKCIISKSNSSYNKVKIELEKRGIETIEVDLEDSEFFGGGIHCSTLDLNRADELIKYV
ncbi:hypothetical protein ACEB11_001798 [Campylobacter coli]